MPTVHLLVKGKVQGVFYRASAKEIAEELGVTGWIKNTEEGDVEITAKGSDEQLQKFIEWCKIGPRRAIVTGVETSELEEASFKGFEVIRRS
jgi:acylphosphatase